MTWTAALIIGISAIICTVLYCFFVILLTGSLLREERAHRIRTKGCLKSLINEINTRFPGSNLKLVEDEDEVKVVGELKYYKKNDY